MHWCTGIEPAFLSTSPARGTTAPAGPGKRRERDFYPRPPRGGRRAVPVRRPAQRNFYPRPPRGGRQDDALYTREVQDFYPRPPRGGRPGRLLSSFPPIQFLSTSPARGTTARSRSCRRSSRISIHVPREGDDLRCRSAPASRRSHFYPRPPRGGRLRNTAIRSAQTTFLSTSPARGTTRRVKYTFAFRCISIHVPREGDDPKRRARRSDLSNFYPRPSRGGRLHDLAQ